MNKKRRIISVVMMFCLLFCIALQSFAAAPKASIKLSSTNESLKVGKTLTLTAAVTGKSKAVTWKTSNKNVATVSGGVVTAKKAGKVTITAKANGKTAKCTVTVKKYDYKELYRKFLENSTIQVGKYKITPGYFTILNIDQKNDPELIISPKNIYTQTCYEYYVYTIKNGKVVYAGNCSYFGRGGNPPLYYSSGQKAIVSYALLAGGESNGLYQISSYKLKVKRFAQYQRLRTNVYKTGSSISKLKKVSLKNYNTYYNNYFKNLKKYILADNTEVNRKSILG